MKPRRHFCPVVLAFAFVSLPFSHASAAEEPTPAATAEASPPEPAPTTTPSWAQYLKWGERVRLVLRDGRVVEGKLGPVSGKTLIVHLDGGVEFVVVDRADVVEVGPETRFFPPSPPPRRASPLRAAQPVRLKSESPPIEASIYLLAGERRFSRDDWGDLDRHSAGGFLVGAGRSGIQIVLGTTYSRGTARESALDLSQTAATFSGAFGIRACPRIGFVRPSLELGLELVRTEYRFTSGAGGPAGNDQTSGAGLWGGGGLLVSDEKSGFEIGVAVRSSTTTGRLFGDRLPIGGTVIVLQVGWTGTAE